MVLVAEVVVGNPIAAIPVTGIPALDPFPEEDVEHAKVALRDNQTRKLQFIREVISVVPEPLHLF